MSHTTLLVKNSILQEHNIQNIRSYDELFVFMDVMAEKEEKAGKVKVSSAHYRSLLDYATVKAGYYPVHNRSHPNIVCKIDDEYVFGNKTLNRSKEYLNLAKRAMYPPLYKQLEFCHSDHYNDYKIMDSGYFNSPIIKKRTEYIQNALKKLYEDPSSITADEMKVALDEMTDQDEVLKVYNDFMCKLLS